MSKLINEYHLREAQNPTLAMDYKFPERPNSIFQRGKILIGICAILTLVIFSSAGAAKSKSYDAFYISQNDSQDIITMTVRDIIVQYNKNGKLFNKNYKGKEFIITGVIEEISDDSIEFEVPFMLGDMDNPQVSMVGIQCVFKDDNELLDLSAGETVSVRGVYYGKEFVFLDFRNCALVK